MWIQYLISKIENSHLSKISIIIPTYNEAKNLPLLLSDLSILEKEAEIIIIDSVSEDKTAEIATFYGANIYISNKKNRGLQLNIGAKKAMGEWFIFLHADSRLSREWFTKIKTILEVNESSIYFLKFKIDDKNLIYRVPEILVNLRSRLFKTPYGDQGLIISRKSYFNNDGFREIPLMEDLDFIKRLKNKKNLKSLNFPIYTSPRKWEKTNIFLQAIKNWQLRRRWFKGESIQSIYYDYYKK